MLNVDSVRLMLIRGGVILNIIQKILDLLFLQVLYPVIILVKLAEVPVDIGSVLLMIYIMN